MGVGAMVVEVLMFALLLMTVGIIRAHLMVMVRVKVILKVMVKAMVQVILVEAIIQDLVALYL